MSQRQTNAGSFRNDATVGLADQGLLSLGSFLTIILLVRWSDVVVVGQVALVLNLLTLAIFLQAGAIKAFTFLVAGEGREASSKRLGEVIWIHKSVIYLFVLSLGMSTVGTLILGRDSNVTLVAAAAVLIAGSLLYELERRIMWALMNGARSLIWSAARFGLLVGGAALIKLLNLRLDTLVALGWLASIRLVTIPQLIRHRKQAPRYRVHSDLKRLWPYWEYGRWVLALNVLAYAAGNVYVPLVATLLGFGAAGQFEIGRQLVAPFYILPLGVASYLLPRLTADHKHLSTAALWAGVKRIVIKWLAVVLAGCAAFLVLGRPLLFFLFGRDAAVPEVIDSIPVLAFLGGAVACNILGETILLAVGRPDKTFAPMAFAAITNVAIGLPLLLNTGIRGAFLGNAVASLLAAVFFVRAVLVVRREQMANATTRRGG